MVIPKAPSGSSPTVICAIGVCFPELSLNLLESHLLALCLHLMDMGRMAIESVPIPTGVVVTLSKLRW